MGLGSGAQPTHRQTAARKRKTPAVLPRAFVFSDLVPGDQPWRALKRRLVLLIT